MRLTKSIILVSVMLICSSAYAQKDANMYVQPTGKTSVYKNQVRELYEEALFTVTNSDRLAVLEQKGQYYKIRNSEGKTGWVEKRLVVVSGKSKTFIMDDAEVMAHLDNQHPIYIMDMTDPTAEHIKLDRSFSDALRENVDRETVERQTTLK